MDGQAFYNLYSQQTRVSLCNVECLCTCYIIDKPFVDVKSPPSYQSKHNLDECQDDLGIDHNVMSRVNPSSTF